ncbi:hypothetical protein [Enterobacter mori]|uniref:hypothetical protein n=1 Tax=Enterobacter mori TaxID=539813 RepID=UPI003B83FD33
MSASLLSRLSDNHPQREEEDDYWWENDISKMLLTELELLFTSRVRQAGIEAIPLVNASILNYGINESLWTVTEANTRRLVMEQRLLNLLSRFEPRLTRVSLTSTMDNPAFILFTLNAYYMQSPVVIELKWNDCTGRFYFDE